MELEKEIQQKKFKNEYHKLIVNIIYTANWVTYENQKIFKQFGLTLPQYNILRILRGSFPEPVTVNQLIERMLDKSSNASRIVDKLFKKGLVSRTICEKDRRSVDVVIRKEGLALLDKIEPALSKSEERFRTLTEKEAKTLNRLLDKLRS